MLKALAACFAILVSSAVPAQAQDLWPARPIRLVAASSPGGGTDTYARLLSQGLSEAFKQQIVVDNRPGASGNIAAEIVAKAPPDGYTLLVSSSSALVINPSLFKNLPYSLEHDLAPVARGVISPIVVTAHPSLPVTTLPALVALAKREPGKLSYGSPGPGSPGNLAIKMLEEITGARFVHIPYKGASQAVIGLLRGDSMLLISDVNTVRPHVQSRKIIAIAGSHRTAQLPATPSFAEAGYPSLDSSPFFGVTAPGGTPVTIIERFAVEIARTMKMATFREKLDAHSLIPVFDTPQEFGAFLKKERARYAEIIRRNAIVAE